MEAGEIKSEEYQAWWRVKQVSDTTANHKQGTEKCEVLLLKLPCKTDGCANIFIYRDNVTNGVCRIFFCNSSRAIFALRTFSFVYWNCQMQVSFHSRYFLHYWIYFTLNLKCCYLDKLPEDIMYWILNTWKHGKQNNVCVSWPEGSSSHSHMSSLQASRATPLWRVAQVNRWLGGLSRRMWTLSITGAFACVCV